MGHNAIIFLLLKKLTLVDVKYLLRRVKNRMETLATIKVSIVLCPIMTATETLTKERIRQKADELFMKLGIRNVSMDDIANALGMSKKTIYQYFTDKNDLVDAVVVKSLEDMQHDCGQCFEHSRDAIHEIFLTMEQILEQFRNMTPVVLMDLEKLHNASYQKFRDHKNKFLLQIIRNNIDRGIREGLYREDVNPDTISRFRLESIMIPFNMEIFPPNRYNLADVTKEIIEHYVFGLATTKGHKLILKYKEERTKAKHYETLPGSKAK